MSRAARLALFALLAAASAAAQIAPDTARVPRPRPDALAPAAPAETVEPDAPAPAAIADRPGALLRGLDKFTGVASDVFAPLDETAVFGRLEITLRACRPDAEGEAAAWLYISDPKQGPAPVFAGWMFAESPALSALDHPRYDVWVAACSTASVEAE